MKPSEVLSFEIVVDGGCKNNGSADAKSYGSFVLFSIRPGGVRKEVNRSTFDLPAETNNQAEYQSLIQALEYLKKLYDWYASKDLQFPRAKIITDSKLIEAQMLGTYKTKDLDLRALRDEARVLMTKTGGQIEWRRKEDPDGTLAVLGHLIQSPFARTGITFE